MAQKKKTTKSPAKAKKTSAATAKKTVKKAASQPKKATKQAAKATKISQDASQKAAQTMIDQIKDYTKPYMAPAATMKGMEAFMNPNNFQFEKFTKDATEASRENVEAFIKCGTIFAKGFENILKTAANLTQTAGEKQAELTKQMMGAKTLNEFTSLQKQIAQTSLDEMMSNTTKLSEMSVKLINDSMAPLNEQINKGLQKAQKMAA